MKKLYLKKILGTIALVGMVILPFSAQAVTIIPEGRATSGDLTITNSTTRTEDSVKSAVSTLANSGDTAVIVSSATGFVAGDYIFIGQMQGTGAGNYEINKIRSISSNTLNLFYPTISAYQSTGAQVIRVNEYHNVTINSGGKWTANAWSGTTGGVLVALLNGTFTESNFGTTTVDGLGFGGGSSGHNPAVANQGDSSTGAGAASSNPNGAGGGHGGSHYTGAGTCGGGGAGYSSSGGNGTASALCIDDAGNGHGVGGNSQGNADLSTLFLGAGGGGGSDTSSSAGGGGTGSGIAFIIIGNSATFSGGSFSSTGNNGTSAGGPGGGGAGGSIRLAVKNTLTLGSGIVSAAGGAAGANGGGANAGGGSTGRIATISSATVTGTASPTIDTSSTDRVQNKDNEAMTVNLSSSI